MSDMFVVRRSAHRSSTHVCVRLVREAREQILARISRRDLFRSLEGMLAAEAGQHGAGGGAWRWQEREQEWAREREREREREAERQREREWERDKEAARERERAWLREQARERERSLLLSRAEHRASQREREQQAESLQEASRHSPNTRDNVANNLQPATQGELVIGAGGPGLRRGGLFRYVAPMHVSLSVLGTVSCRQSVPLSARCSRRACGTAAVRHTVCGSGTGRACHVCLVCLHIHSGASAYGRNRRNRHG